MANVKALQFGPHAKLHIPQCGIYVKSDASFSVNLGEQRGVVLSLPLKGDKDAFCPLRKRGGVIV